MSKLSDRLEAAVKIMVDAGLKQTENTMFIGNKEYKITVNIQHVRTYPQSNDDANPYD